MHIVNIFFPHFVQKHTKICSGKIKKLKHIFKKKHIDKTKALCYNENIHSDMGGFINFKIWWAEGVLDVWN